MSAKLLMFQGTASHVGKSIMATAFCRLLRRRGVRVAPFKAMNMSNNAWVTNDGGEMAYAQAVQAWACGLTPTVEMNPVLLKPLSEGSSQVIISGRPLDVVKAADLSSFRGKLLSVIEDSLQTLMHAYDFVVLEGAGSPAEVNLQETDLANMVVARKVHAPVVLVADIERGGVFAQIVGTLELLREEDRALLVGFLINKFRGEIELLEPGLRWLKERTGLPILGVMPFLERLQIPEEDSLGAQRLGSSNSPPDAASTLTIQVIRYPTIANFTDFDPLYREPGVCVEYIAQPPSDGKLPDLLVLPGSRSTISDLIWLKRSGLDQHILQCVKEGIEVLGICGGFQMLGGMIYDPSHAESRESAWPGLGLLPVNTLFLPSKVTAQVKAVHLESGEKITGYEIHAGRPQGARRGSPVFRLEQRAGAPVEEWDGCADHERPIWGTYLHGLFEESGFRNYLLRRIRTRRGKEPLSATSPSQEQGSASAYDALADEVERHVAVEELLP